MIRTVVLRRMGRATKAPRYTKVARQAEPGASGDLADSGSSGVFEQLERGRALELNAGLP
jgi:hypothetical protein